MNSKIKKDGDDWAPYLELWIADKLRVKEDPGFPYPDTNNGIESQIKRLSEGVGRLATMLHEKGVLSKDEVLEIVSVDSFHYNKYTITKEED